jgi:hypothetical protein
MRLSRVSGCLAAAALVAGCSNKSKLDSDRGDAVESLWALAPDGTELGVVASPRAVGLAFRAIAAVRELIAQPDLAAVKPQVDDLAKAMFGSETATPADAGFGDKAFAMFATADGVIGVMPVADRDKFMAAKKGTRGSAEDVLDTTTCRELRGHYVCSTQVAMFDRLGKGGMRGKLGVIGTRGDAELFMAGTTLLGDTKGDLAVALQLEPGQAEVHGRWIGAPSGMFAKLIGSKAPRPTIDGATGFVTFDAAPLLGSLPSVPIAGGVTTDQLAASMVGPITASIPSGSIDIQVRMPLKDPGPAMKIVENCTDVGALFALADKQTPGACRIRLQGTNALELDIWVEGNELRLGANKGPAPAGKPGAITRVGRELASSDWTGTLWGRGTMLNLSGMTPTVTDVPDEVALGIHAMALVNELGAGLKVEADGLRFRAFMRTVWANPPDVVAKYVAITGSDILTGKATEQAKALAATAPNSPFAADFSAGQGGLMIPAGAIGLVTAIVIPAIARYMSGGGNEMETVDPSAPTQAPMNNSDLASLLVRAYVEEAYPKWKADNAGKTCPAKLDELAKYFGENPGIPVMQDPWGHDLVMQCDAKGLVVISIGEDGKQGTADDVRSL